MSGKHCANCGVGTLPTPSPGTPPTTGSGCPRTLTKPCGRWWTSGTPTSAPVAMPPCTPGGERNVDALNRIARDRFALDGRLTGPEVVAPGGRHYSVGDRIVTLAPAADGQVVTSERGEVVSVDVHRPSLIASNAKNSPRTASATAMPSRSTVPRPRRSTPPTATKTAVAAPSDTSP